MIGNMNLSEKNGVSYLTFPIFEKYNFIKHAFSTRLGGVSENEFFSMNLGFNRGDHKECVLENYKRLCDAVGICVEDLVASSQDHGTNIRCVGENEKGIGLFKPHDIKSVDGLLTDVKNVALVTYYADCTPLYFFDPVKKVIGLAHSGWRGTVNKIGKKMIEKMRTDYSCDEKNILCAIGPTIGKCCFEVGEDVAKEFLKLGSFAENFEDGKYFVDLQEANKKILREAGVPSENITLANVCTSCHSNLLFSHRKTKGKRGTMVAILELI